MLRATKEKETNWDKEVDVVVVGFGAAGGVSAITAHDAGAKVLLIENMPNRLEYPYCRAAASHLLAMLKALFNI